MSMYEFTDSIQEKILGVLWRDTLNYPTYKECIKPKYFTKAVHNDICRIITEYWKQYSAAPTLEALVQEVKKLIKGSKVKAKLESEYISTLSNMSEMNLDDLAYIKDQIVEFGKNQAMTDAIIQSAQIIEQRKDFSKVEKLVKDALLVGEDIGNVGIDFWDNYEQRIQDYSVMDDVIQRISTGSGYLDNMMKGGLGKTELGIVLAPPGRGKTTWLINMGAAALSSNHTVVHYSLENHEKQVIRNYDLRMVEQNFEFVKNNASSVVQALQMRKKVCKGNLFVKKYAPFQASVDTIRSHLNQLKAVKGVTPDVIIVDYGALLRSTANYKEKREGLEANYIELKALATEFDCAVWSGAQGTRGSLSKKVVTMADLAECFAIANISDFMIALCQTHREQGQQIMRYFLAKQRDNRDHITLLGHDYRDKKVMTVEEEWIDPEEDDGMNDDAVVGSGAGSWE